MRIVAHPDYANLPILIAESVLDRPVAGQFFVPAVTDSLSAIASRAYGNGRLMATQRINKSRYNMEHCFYRKDSTSCKSPLVAGSLAASAPASWAPYAWIALCPGDRAGLDGLGTLLATKYQIIWIPTEDGKEPWDLVPGVDAPPPSAKPGLSVDPVVGLPGSGSTTGGGIGIGEGNGGGPVDEEPVEPKKAGLPWWLGGLLGLGALTSVIYFAIRDKKNKRKAG